MTPQTSSNRVASAIRLSEGEGRVIGGEETVDRLADLRHVGRAGEGQAHAEIDFLDDPGGVLSRRIELGRKREGFVDRRGSTEG